MNANKKGKKYERRIAEYFAAPAVNIPMKLKFVQAIGNLYFIKIKFIPGTTENKIRRCLGDARQALRLQLLQLHSEDMDIFFVASDDNTFDNRLFGILTSPSYGEYTKDILIPFPIGFDVMLRPHIVDLVLYYNWLLGGAGGSGKTNGIQCFIASILWSCSPEDVNIIIIDEPANLTQFADLPHLACPVIYDTETGYRVIMKLHIEMKRRLKLREENPDEFNNLPKLVCFIDECVSFVAGIGDKESAKTLADTISLILRMGRHAKIYLVLATQNAAVDDMKCDLRPITSRISYKAAKLQDSVTILGEGGADKLLGRGEMYFKSQQHSGLMYLKGARITKDEVEAVCNHVRTKYEDVQWDDTYKFTIDMNATVEAMENSPFIGSIATAQEIEDEIFARIIIWSLERATVSANAIKLAFATDKVGERQAKRFIERLYSLGIVGDAIEKLPRKVIITCVEDLQDEVKSFLDSHGCNPKTNEFQESIQPEGEPDAEQTTIVIAEVKTTINEICPTCGQSID